MKRLLVLILVGVLLISSFAACTIKDEGVEEKGEVVATVNDKEIKRVDYENLVENMKLSYQQFGIDFNNPDNKGMLAMIEEEAINNLIQQELILQSSKEKGYEVTRDEIDYEMEQIKQQFENEEEFLNVLELNKLTLEELEVSVERELLLGRYIQGEIGEAEVTEEEVIALYEEYRNTMEDISPMEEMLFDLEEEIKYEKFQQKFQEIIDELYEKSNIVILL